LTQSGGTRRPWLTGDKGFLLAVCALNVALRLPLLALDVVPTSDFGWYFDAAHSIASGDGFTDKGIPTAFWPVGWPGFLAGPLWLLGPNVWVGQCVNLMLSVGVIGLTAAVGKRLFPGTGAGRLAILLIAVFPNQIAYVPLLSVEPFFEFLLMLGFLLLIPASRRADWYAPRVARGTRHAAAREINKISGSFRFLLAAGVVFGAAALTKTQAVLMPAVLALPLLACGIRRWLRTVLLTGVVMLAVILPWTLRNYLVLHAFVPISTNGGYTLLTGNNPSAEGRYTADDPLVAELSKDPHDQVATDRLARDLAWGWIVANPHGFVRLIPLKIWRLWSGDGEAEWLYQAGYAGYQAHAGLFRAVRIANQIYYVVLLALAALAVPQMWRRRRSLPVCCWSGWAVALYFTVISAVFSGQSRFHFALMPFMALYAGFAVTARPRPWGEDGDTGRGGR
jgi:4-amino-4-deoxy-L-arabinose transferase-like glycosyltransferase